MQHKLSLFLAVTLTGGVAGVPLRAADPDPKVAQQGFNFLKKYCFDCHGKKLEKPPLKVLDHDILTKHKRKKAPFFYVVPGKPDESYLWQRVGDEEMPPEDAAAKPTAEERKAFKAWIEAGAPFPTEEKSTAKNEKEGQAAPDLKLAQRAYIVLNKYCYACHGLEMKKPPLKVLDHTILLQAERKKKPSHYVEPGKPDESYLWQRVRDGEMPPEAVTDRPTEEEKDVIKTWIAAGAPAWTLEKRAFKSEKDILTDIHNHLQKMVSADRKFQRYFTLTHLHNNRKVTGPEFRLYRAALAKLVNSLTWEGEIVVPQAIDKEQTIYNIDLRRLGWHKQAGRPDIWAEILKVYPYGLAHDEDKEEDLRELAKEVYRLAGTNLLYLRADWFIVTAAQPPLYHTVLQLPDTAAKLEKDLKVNVEQNFLNDNLVRAGFTSSGVSRNNRLVERHPSLYGAYWKSYDFNSSSRKGNLLRFPLGPVFKNNPFPDQAFEQAGGEIIFNLPNGLQGYLLVDKDGKRINRGPIAIVRDPSETAGTPEVVNGISCMHCHKHGMFTGFTDVLRTSSGVFGQAQIKVERLHPKPTEMNRLLQKDERRFMQALEEATGVFLKVAEDKDKDLAKFDDPIGKIAKFYAADLDLETVASELGFADPKDFERTVTGNNQFKELGLGPLLEGASIKRELWDFLEGNSLFQDVASEAGLGIPLKKK
jgi:serine/threonine-protein kinase